MTDETKKEVEDKMTPQLAAKAEYLMQLARLQTDGLAKTLTELTETMKACGCETDSTPIHVFCKSLSGMSQSLQMGGAK